MSEQTNLSDVISALSANTDLSSILSGVLSGQDQKTEGGDAISKLTSILGADKTGPSKENAAAALPSILGALSGSSGGKKSEYRALLLALKPFLGERRKRVIDILVSMEKLGIALPGGR